ncbi:MAG: hypothetical protein KDB03_03760 [Planctomycetales bacterium]|nr:hypothetical protein [Planctomycetales bacterium]
MEDNKTDHFAEFLNRIRAGDETAACQLVTEFQALVRREVRMRLLDPRLRRVLDSGDVCQSVLASFFVRVSAGQYELDNSHDLLKLLITMARNKSAEVARRHYQQRRDVRRHEAPEKFELADQQLDSPSQLVACNEILERVHKLMTAEELQIVQMRRDGCSWQEIANRMGGTADARRIQLARATERLCKSLNLDPSHA